MRKLVSILIPAYNADRWIEETLQSALSQTWPRKEIIVVDDGSSDQTYAIAQNYESNILKLIRQENKGASSARNRALSNAQGDYIQWLDADDLLEPKKIETQIAELQRGYGDLALFSGAFVEFFSRPEKGKASANSLYRDLDPVEWLVTKFRDNVWMSPAVWLVSRHITEKAGLWDERLSLDDDGEYFSRVVAASNHVYFVPEARAYYRQSHSGSLSRTKSDKARKSLFLSLTLCVGYLRNLEESQRTRNACVSLLQTWSHYFYPDNAELYEGLCKLAAEMGGAISPPRLKWKYALIEKTFGWRTADKTRDLVATLKLNTSFHVDRWLSSISSWRDGK